MLSISWPEGLDGAVVLKGGRVICEEYFHGFGPDTPHHVASVTKSVLSALVGVALAEGCLRSIRQPVLELFPEHEADPAGWAARVTLQHLLTMTAAWPLGPGPAELEALCSAPNWTGYLLEQLSRCGEPGLAFQYSTMGAQLLAAALTRAVGCGLLEYANTRLFAPAGMRPVPDLPMKGFGREELFGWRRQGWTRDPQGVFTGGWGLCLPPRDMARLGELYLAGGSWNGRQVLPAEWAARSTQPGPHGYGYLWWCFSGGGPRAFAALGDGGNMLLCIPEKELVVALTGHSAPGESDRQEFLFGSLLPALGE